MNLERSRRCQNGEIGELLRCVHPKVIVSRRTADNHRLSAHHRTLSTARSNILPIAFLLDRCKDISEKLFRLEAITLRIVDYLAVENLHTDEGLVIQTFTFVSPCKRAGAFSFQTYQTRLTFRRGRECLCCSHRAQAEIGKCVHVVSLVCGDDRNWVPDDFVSRLPLPKQVSTIRACCAAETVPSILRLLYQVHEEAL